MAHVTGPFIEYPCSRCGAIVQENAHPDPKKLHERIVEANTIPHRRLCAGCGTALIDWPCYPITEGGECMEYAEAFDANDPNSKWDRYAI